MILIFKCSHIPLPFQSTQPYQFQVGSGALTPTGTLTYATLLPSKAHHGLSPGYNVVQSPSSEEIPAHEPDFSKKPLRSAMKGSKQKAMLHQQLALQLRQKQDAMGTPPGGSSPANRPSTGPLCGTQT